MTITPYTPISELRRAIKHTYASQALGAFMSAVAIKMAMFVFDSTLFIINEQSAFAWRLFFSVSGGTSIFLLLRALWLSMFMFIDAGKARSGIKWLIAKKQSSDLR